MNRRLRMPAGNSAGRRAWRPAALVAALAVVAATLLVGYQPHAAEASCGTLTTKSVSGTLAGEDGHAVNGVIGFTFVDDFGNRLDARGCRLEGDQYGRVVHLNAQLPANGAAPSGDTSSFFWIDRIPSNVKEVWVESYPKNVNGTTDYSHYTGVYRGKVPPGTGGLNLRFPVGCSAGGRTGAIAGDVWYKGQRVTPNWVGFWSESETSAQMGYGMGKTSNGSYVSPPLSSSPAAGGQPQRYRMQMYIGSVFVQRTNIPVYPCTTTNLRVDAS